MILSDDGHTAHLRLTPPLVALFADKRVFSSMHAGPARWAEGEEVYVSRSIEVGRYSGFFAGSALWNMGAYSYSWSALPWNIQIGRYCSISWGVLSPGPRHPIEAVATTAVLYERAFQLRTATEADFALPGLPVIPNPEKGGIIIGNDVWIGSGVWISPGVRIGDGAVVAAGSIVTRDVAPYTVVGGNPAQVIKRRFPDDICEALQRTAWWRYGLHQLCDYSWTDPARFVTELSNDPPEAVWSPETLTWDDIAPLL